MACECQKIIEDDHPVKELIPYLRQFKDKTVYFRPLCRLDEKAIQDFFYSHKPETIYQRYLMIVKDMPDAVAQARVRVDYNKDMAIAGFDSPAPNGKMVCIGRYIRGKNESAEAAVVIKEDYQGRGIGTFLNEILIQAARRHKLKKLAAYVGHGNLSMIHIFKKLGFSLQESRDVDGFLAVKDLD
ncbi:MAG: N-acetyltransferase [Candidatus Omnitrophica bacterium]|nr:N-acetyltransferase [Candidatus Omnitrophota bacterium]